MKTVLSSIGGQSVSKAYDEADNSDATAPLQSGAVGTSGTIVTVDLKAGTRGKNYLKLPIRGFCPRKFCVRTILACAFVRHGRVTFAKS
jgi:hypothetical protein